MKKLLFIGPISPPITGPGVKNQEMLSIFRQHFEVKTISTLQKWNLVWLLKNIVFILTSRNIVYSVSEKGRYLYSIINRFFCFICIFEKKTILYVAGGSLDKEILSLPKFIREIYLYSLKGFDKIIVESLELVHHLNSLNLNNVEYMANGRCNRNIDFVLRKKEPLKFIYLSKIREEKGIFLAIDAINEYANINHPQKAILDIYGVIDNDVNFTNKLNDRIELSKGLVSYKGICKPEKVQNLLSEYDVFIFPTLLPEGMPGVIVEAMLTNIPIITTDFKCRKEILNNEIDCIVFEKTKESIVLAMNTITDFNLRSNISNNLKESSMKFSLDKLMKEQIDYIRG